MPPKVPCVKGLPILGSVFRKKLLAYGPKKFHLYVDENHRELGPIYWENLNGFKAVYVADPGVARKVFLAEGHYPRHFIPEPWEIYNNKHNINRGLFFLDGPEWHNARKALNPIFLKNNFESSLGEVHSEVSDAFLLELAKFEGKEIKNLERMLYKHSLSFLVANLLGKGFTKNMDFFEEDIQRLSSIANSLFVATAKVSRFPVRLAAALNLQPWKEFVQATELSFAASKSLTEKILKADLSDGLLKDIIKLNLDPTVLYGFIFDLVLAAGDTTTFTSQWAMYLLSKNRSAVEKLREDSTLVRGVLRETLRLYPAAIFITRYLEQDLPALGYVIPKGEMVILSLYSLGRLEEVYPEVEEFRPERWERQSPGHVAGVKDTQAYLPFALGSRSCIGRKLAELQIYHTLNKIFSKFNLELVEEVDMELQLVPVPSKPLRILVSKR